MCCLEEKEGKRSKVIGWINAANWHAGGIKMSTRNYGYLEKDDLNQTFSIKKGQFVAGYTIGILLLEVWYPLLPGNVVNASTFKYPVRHKVIHGATQERVHSGDATLLDSIILAGKELENEGVRAIVGACGYLAHFQTKASEIFTVPTYLSSMLQIPLIKSGLRPHEKIGVLCADKDSLDGDIFKKVGIDNPDVCIVSGLGDEPEFSAILKSDRGCFNNGLLRKEVVKAAEKMVKDNRDIGAILLECSDMPPYAADIQKSVNLPVYDFITMINWVHNSVAQMPYYGYA